MAKIIKVNPLRVSSIESAIKELEDYRKMLEEFPKRYTEELIKALSQFIAVEAPFEALALMKQIDVINFGNRAEGVIVFDGHVEFIEFGTGEVGLTLHNGINEEWLTALPPPYNTGWNTGSYIVHNKGHNGMDYWKYRDENGNWVTTSGIPANPFLYRSVERLIEAHKRIRKEVLGG